MSWTGSTSAVIMMVAGLLGLGAVLAIAEPAEVLERVRAVRPAPLVAATVLFCLVYGLMTLRLVRSLGRPVADAFWPAMRMSVRHGFLLAVLPARLGDAAYPALLARALSVPVGVAVGNLLILRIMDVAVVAGLFAVAATALLVGPADPQYLVWGMVGCVTAALASIHFLPVLLRVAARLVVRLLGRRWSIARSLLRAGRWTASLTTASKIEMLLWSAARWLAAAAVIAALFSAYDAPLGLAEAVFIAAGLNLVAVIPAQSFGGLGLMEASLALLLLALGRPAAEAATLGLSVRLTWLMLPIGAGAVAECLGWIMARRNRSGGTTA